MKTKRIVKLSELHQIIGNYLYVYGDADITSIATHTNHVSNNHLKYTLHLAPLNREMLPNEEEDILGIDYHISSIENKIPSGIKVIDEPLNGNVCVICGKPIHSNIKSCQVCNKCANGYEF